MLDLEFGKHNPPPVIDRSERWRKYIVRFAVAIAALTLLAELPPVRHAIAQGFTLLNGTVFRDHMLVAGIPPTVTNATLASGSTDLAGSITLSGASTPVLTFGTAWNTKPFCTATDNGEAEGLKLVITVSTLTFTGFAGSDPISYICFGTIGN